MIDFIASVAGMFFTNEALAAEKKPQPAPVIVVQTAQCKFKDPAKIRECLDAKFKDDRDPYADMWDQNWINRR
jgi:hypothetical protein